MTAGEMLQGLTMNPFHEEYRGIYTNMNGKMVPITTAKPDSEGNLIFFRENKKESMKIKTLFSILLIHKEKELYCWNNQKIDVYSFRIEHGKIIV